MNKVHLVVPVYNDWESFRVLLHELDAVAASLPFQLFVSAVDDGSIDDPIPSLSDLSGLHHLVGVEIITLAVNVGHQRAIAIGLCAAAQQRNFDAVLIMDADGEDPPQSLLSLTRDIGQRTDFCFVAQRKKRVETLLFKFFYLLYKFFFKLVTGRRSASATFASCRPVTSTA